MQDMKENISDEQVAEPVRNENPDTRLEECGNNVVTQRKGFTLFYLCPILYILSVYQTFFRGLYTLAIFWGVINIIVCIVYCKPENRNRLFNAIVFMKYALIPCYATIFPLLILIAVLYGIDNTLSAQIPELVAALVLGWLCIAFQCPYMIAYLKTASGENKIIGGSKRLHLVLQFFFVFDVLDVMVLTFIEKRWRRLTVSVWIILLMACITVGTLFALGLISMGGSILAFGLLSSGTY